VEALIRFLDDVEDAIISAASSLRRKLARRPRERRQVARLGENSPKPISKSVQQDQAD
jgi:hypothetical protein